MRLILFTSVLSGGGAERVLCQLANRFAEKNQVTLVAAYSSENEYEISPKVNKEYLDLSLSDKNPCKQIVKLRQLIRREKPDVCISFLPQPNFKMILATLGIKTKVFVSVRNDPAREYKGVVNKLLAKLLYPLASGVVFQTKDAQSWFSCKVQAKSRVIMNQVAPAFFQRELGCSEYYVATGRLNNQKNYPMMIRAFARFLQSYPDQKLYIYGAGSLKEELESLIYMLGVSDRIVLKGSSSDIPTVLSNAKAFLLSSDYEGMPNGLLEAMAMGVPCISTDCPCGGPREVIENGISGILVGVKDETAMYQALCKIQENTELREKMGQRAKQEAMKFHPDMIFEQWNDYVGLIEKA